MTTTTWTRINNLTGPVRYHALAPNLTKVEKPLIFFDLETTGVQLESDRIVQIAATKVSRDLKTVHDRKNVILNPDMPIPAEATEVHGITDEMTKDAPYFKQISKGLYTFMEGCDLAGFNILNFDVPLLGEEFGRCQIEWPAAGTIFIDVYKIFAEKEKRDLAGALKFYKGITHETAHTADGDVDATVDVFIEQLARYEDLGAMTLEQIADFCMPEKRLDLAGKIILNEQGVAVFSFGKDKGKPVRESVGFANWMLKGNFPENTKNVVRRILGWTKTSKPAK